MSDMNIGLDTELEVKVRAYNMALISGRMLQALGANAHSIETAVREIAASALIRIEGVQWSGDVAKTFFAFHFDWDASRVNVEASNYRKTIPLRAGVKVEDQVREELRLLVQYLAAKTSSEDVDRCEIIYFHKNESAAQRSGFRSLSDERAQMFRDFRDQRGRRFSSGEYPEMGFDFVNLD